MSETIEAIIEVPCPPSGYRAEKRKPQSGEECYIFLAGGWKIVNSQHDWHEDNAWKQYVFAYRIPKKKRLMTPHELASKWIHLRD